MQGVPPGCARRFQVGSLLAEGGFGAVFEATQLELNRRVALKLLRLTPSDGGSNVLERFLREARGTAALSHPNIVRIVDHGVEDDVPWIAYEFCAGGSLADLMRKERLDWKRALLIARQVCLGLEAAHAANILHRDIKPHNVLFADAGVVKIADFGLAQWNIDATVLTATGALLGTPHYMAPELVKNESGPKVDQYAVGVMLFEMLTHRRMFEATTPVNLILKHVRDPRPVPSEVAAGLTPELDRLVLKAVARDPLERYADMAALRTQIELALPESCRTGGMAVAETAGALYEEAIQRKPSRPTPRPSRPTPRLSRPTAKNSATPVPAPRTRAPLALLAGLSLGLAAVALFAWPRDAGVMKEARDLPPASPLAAASPRSPVPLDALVRAWADVRAERDRVGMVGHVMFRQLGPAQDAVVIRAELTRLQATYRALHQRIATSLAPLEAPHVVRPALPHAVVVAAARLAAERLLATTNTDRATRFIERMGNDQDREFMGSDLGLMLNQDFSRDVLVDVDRHLDWLAAEALQLDASPAAFDQTAWALLDFLNSAKQFCQTPIAGFKHAHLVQRMREQVRYRLPPSDLPARSAATRLLDGLFTIGVQGNVAASAPVVDAIVRESEELARLVPGAAAAFGSLPARVRSLYPPRGAPGATITPDWPFPRWSVDSLPEAK